VLLLVSTKKCDPWQIHGLPVTLRMLRVKPSKSDWLRTGNDYSAHPQKIVLILGTDKKRSEVSGDKNALHPTNFIETCFRGMLQGRLKPCRTKVHWK